jgi:ribosome recycling factor
LEAVDMGDWESRMNKPVRSLAEQLRGIRAGTLSPGFIETFRVPVHGSPAPIGHVASIAMQQGRIVITPFDRSLVPAIVKALTDARQNAYALDPARVCVSIPPISGEQRAEIGRHVKKLGEDARVAVRSTRQDIRKQMAALGRRPDRTVQEITDGAIAEIDRLVGAKLDELEG